MTNVSCPKCGMPGQGVHWSGCPDLQRQDLALGVDAAATNERWYLLISRIAMKVGCLPSMFPDSNEHIERKIDELIARAGQRTGASP